MQNNEMKASRTKILMWRVLGALGIVLVILALLVVALPSIISMDGVRRAVVSKVNASISGKLAIESWSFGWRAGAHITGIAFSDNSNVTVRVKEVSTSKGLLGLLANPKTVGEVVVDAPEIVAVVVPPPAAPGADGAPPPAGVVPPSPSAKTAPAAVTPAEPIKLDMDFVGTIKVKGGKLTIRMPSSAETCELQDVNATVTIESLNKPVVFDLSLAQVGGPGRLTVSGSVKAFEGGVFDPAKLRADIKCGFEALSLAPLSAVGAALAGTPSVSGALNSKISARVNGTNSFAAEGFVHLTNLVVSGAALTTDRPFIKSVILDFDVGLEGRDLKIKTFKFDSPLLVLTVAGSLADKKAKYPTGFLNAEGRIDLARVARELPATLRLAKGVAVSRGTLSAKVNLESAGESLDFTLQADVADVEATSDGQTRTLDSPIALTAKVKLDKDGPQIDRFRVTSAFANADGSGDLKDMRVAVKVDIAAAIREAAKFIDLGGMTAAGMFDATARVYSVSEQLRQIEATLGVENLKIAGKTPNPILLDRLTAGAGMQLKSDAQGVLTEIADVRLTVASDPVSIEATVAHIKPGKAMTKTEVQAAEVKVQASIGKLVDLAGGMGVMPAGFKGQGDVNLALNAAMAKGIINTEPVAVTIANLMISPEPGKRFVESNATVVATLQADLSSSRLKVSGAKVTWSSGVLDMPLLTLSHWDKTPAELEGTGAAKVNVERLLTQLPGFVALQPGAAITGGLDADFGISSSGTVRAVTLDAVSRELAFKVPAGQTLAEPGLKLTLRADQSISTGDLMLKQLQLVSSAVGFSATGSLVNIASSCDLGLNGLLECDFKRIAELVALFSGVQLDMTGKKPQPFAVRASLGGKDTNELLQRLKADAGVYLAQCRAFGLQITNLEFKVAADKGLIRSELGTRVNDGELKLTATVDATGKAMVLTIPPDSKVLSDVRLTEAMMADLVAKVHPILRGCGVKSGRVDLLLRKCVVPLDASWTNATSMRGELTLRDVTVGAGGVIGSILEVTRQPTEHLTISNQVVTFTCADGRVTTSPLVLASGDYRMTISGSVGLDGTLQYVAEVPMTEKLVGAKRYPYVKDVVIKIPIEGTATKPAVSSEAVTKAVAAVAQEAAANVLVEQGTKALEGWLQKQQKKK